MPSVRIVHSSAPADLPSQDLHIWTPSAMCDLADWRADRDFPRWIGINAAHTCRDYDRWFSLIAHLLSETNAGITFVVYTAIYCDDAESPCGCYCLDGVCTYHRTEKRLIADCGCSHHLKTVCAYHER